MKTSLSVLLAALYAVLSACSEGNGADQPDQPGTASQSSVAMTRAPGSGEPLPNFAALVDQYGKAVVNVEVVQEAQPTRGPGEGPTSDDPLLDFFRRFGLPGPGGGGPE